MKLELKHLAAYLPYGLKLANISHDPLINFNKHHLLDDLQIDLFSWQKPILRPLSDLTKEINLNGKKFVPLQVIGNSIYPDCEIWDIDDKGKHFVGWGKYDEVTDDKYGIQLMYSDFESNDDLQFFLFDDRIGKGYFNPPITYSTFQLLLKWHFDIFNLIPNGLAIDINTIK